LTACLHFARGHLTHSLPPSLPHSLTHELPCLLFSLVALAVCPPPSTQDLPTSVKVGQTILCADGSLVLKVKELLADGVMTVVQNNCTIGEKKVRARATPTPRHRHRSTAVRQHVELKRGGGWLDGWRQEAVNRHPPCSLTHAHIQHTTLTHTHTCAPNPFQNMNLPGVVVALPTVTEKDKDDLINFGLKCVHFTAPHAINSPLCCDSPQNCKQAPLRVDTTRRCLT
jgi:hypothetical protein